MLRNLFSPWLWVFASSSPCAPVKSGLPVRSAGTANSTEREEEDVLTWITVGVTHTRKPLFAWKPVVGYLKCLDITWPNATVQLHHYHTLIFSSKLQEEENISKERNWLVRGIQAVKHFLLLKVLVVLPGWSSGSSVTLLNNFQRPLACIFEQEHSHLALKLPLKSQEKLSSVA